MGCGTAVGSAVATRGMGRAHAVGSGGQLERLSHVPRADLRYSVVRHLLVAEAIVHARAGHRPSAGGQSPLQIQRPLGGL